MSDTAVEPYLFFKGQAREAMEFYKDVFGGELEIMSYGDTPNMPIPEGSEIKKDWVMHASLKGQVNIMASDTEQASPAAAKIDLSVGGTDEEKLRKMFTDLSAGGKVNTPLKKNSGAISSAH